MLLVWLAGSPACADGLPPPIHSLTVSPLRDYGIVMGETLTSEIRIAVAPGFTLETETLPQPGSAVNDYLELRETAWQQQTSQTETVYRGKLVYQVFKGVREPETLAVPALPLRFSDGGQTVEAQAPAWNFTLVPLIPPQTPDEAVVLRGGLPAPTPISNYHGRWLSACLAGLAGLMAYASWHVGLLRRRAPPCVRAIRDLKKLRRQPATADIWRQGARLVHAALNETAGQTVFSTQLADFLAANPSYSALQTELQQFFQASDRLFFGNALEYPADYPISRMETLCRQLAAVGIRK